MIDGQCRRKRDTPRFIIKIAFRATDKSRDRQQCTVSGICQPTDSQGRESDVEKMKTLAIRGQERTAFDIKLKQIRARVTREEVLKDQQEVQAETKQKSKIATMRIWGKFR